MNITVPTIAVMSLDALMKDAVAQHGIVAVMDAVVQVADDLNKSVALTTRQRAAYLSAKTTLAAPIPALRLLDFS